MDMDLLWNVDMPNHQVAVIRLGTAIHLIRLHRPALSEADSPNGVD